MVSSINNYQEGIQTGEALQMMAELYSELTVSKLERIRDKIEKNRIFAKELAGVFNVVKKSAGYVVSSRRKTCHAELVSASLANASPNKLGDPDIRQDDTKQIQHDTLNVVLTSNQSFYGGLENRLLTFFKIEAKDGDILVVGDSGRRVLKETSFPKPFASVVFAHDLPTPTELADLDTKLFGYEKILIFYPQFVTMATQKPMVSDISLSRGAVSAPDPCQEFSILEPEAPKMLEFFKAQIIRLLLEQSMLEAELARAAARLLTMDSTAQRAEEYIKQQKKILAKSQNARREIANLNLVLGFLAHKQTS